MHDTLTGANHGHGGPLIPRHQLRRKRSLPRLAGWTPTDI